MKKFKLLLENNSSLCLIAGAFLGVLIKELSLIPSWLMLVMLALVIYISCFKINFSEFNFKNTKDVFIFCIIRFVLIPVILWVIFQNYRDSGGILILTLMPAAISSPVFTNLLGGSVSHSFSILAISSVISIVSIPLLTTNLLKLDAYISATSIFQTLLLLLVLPVCIYLFTKNVKRLKTFSSDWGKFTSILLISAVLALAVAQRREQLLMFDKDLLLSVIVLFTLFFFFSVVGFLLGQNKGESTAISYTCCSTFNNNALGISLCIIYFPQSLLFLVASEIPWALAMIICRSTMWGIKRLNNN